jgi:hypothetical protein
MILASLLVVAHVDDTGGAGPLTLVFPLVLVFVVLPLWLLWLRRSGSS